MSNVEGILDWAPPASWTRILTVDAHAAGEPLRVVLDGWPELPGGTILERRRHAREHHDHLRRALMWEPRGHGDMYGCVLTDPVSPGADFGVLFTHNEGYSTMCGHGIIAVTRVVLELGILPLEEPLTRVGIDTPAGYVRACARVSGDIVTSTFFRNVPSFVLALDREVEVPALGPVRYDLAYGGAFYAYVEAEDFGLTGGPGEAERLVDLGMRIKQAVQGAGDVAHPEKPELGFLYGTIFVAPAGPGDAHSRHVCVFADGELDRSPTGTGVSGRLAILRARGELEVGVSVTIESIVGGRFVGRVVDDAEVGRLPAVIPEVEGRAYLTGRHEFWIDPADPMAHGFLVR